MYKKQSIHLVGIGGVGMSGIAEVLLNLGYPVSGSDLKSGATTRRLKKKGAQIFYGHKKSNIGDATVVVVSSAIKPNNPELVRAGEKQIPVIQRAEMLAELMRFTRYGIAIAGTHGKTTTTSLIASVLYHAGIDPTMIIGGRVNSFRSNARLGRGDFMVAEADESDGSFLKIAPTIVVITNIDREHMEYYKNFKRVKEAYVEFANKIPFYGVAVCCGDHPTVRHIIPQIAKRVLVYGFGPDAEIRAQNIVFREGYTLYDLSIAGIDQGQVTLNLLGEHNVRNSLAAVAVASELGISISKIKTAFKNFKGIQRRCEILLRNTKVTVLDDYGHHPEEIKATLKAIRGSFAGRLVTVFQPHRYTRTKDLYQELTHSFDGTDVLLVTDIYAAGENPAKNITAKKLAGDIKKVLGKKVVYVQKNHKIADNILKHICDGDVVLTLGAGDITRIGREIAQKLKKQSEK